MNLEFMTTLSVGVLHHAILQGGDNGSMVVEYLEIAEDTWHLDALHLTIIFHFLRGNDSKLQHGPAFLSLCLLQQFLTFLYSVLNRSDVEECLLGQVVHLAVENHVEALDGILDRHHHALHARELLCHGERL